MNPTEIALPWNLPSRATLDVLESRFALRVTSQLSKHSQEIAPDISERLRFARENALARARESRVAAGVTAPETTVVGMTSSGSGLLGGPPRWWFRLAAALPGVALVAGLVLIQQWQTSEQISAAAEIDAALLSDDLPPDAYSDAGFVEFLKTPPRE